MSDNEENPLKINSKEQWNSEEILLTLHASKQGHSKIFPGGVPKSTWRMLYISKGVRGCALSGKFC